MADPPACAAQLAIVQRFLGITEGFRCYSDICFDRTQEAGARLFGCMVNAPDTVLPLLSRAQVSVQDSPPCSEDVPVLLRFVRSSMA